MPSFCSPCSLFTLLLELNNILIFFSMLLVRHTVFTVQVIVYIMPFTAMSCAAVSQVDVVSDWFLHQLLRPHQYKQMNLIMPLTETLLSSGGGYGTSLSILLAGLNCPITGIICYVRFHIDWLCLLSLVLVSDEWLCMLKFTPQATVQPSIIG